MSAGELVRTTMLSIAGVVHDGVNLRGDPSSSTRQILQAPKGWSLLSWQRVGTGARRLRASRIVAPAFTFTAFPSTVTVIYGFTLSFVLPLRSLRSQSFDLEC